MRLLLVDDSEINLKIGKELLRRMGYQSAIAASGTEALKATEDQAFDLVFLDVQMPDMDGFETAQKMRQSSQHSGRLIIIALTGSAIEGDRDRCIDAGMDDYLLKPVRVDSLQAMLEKWGSQVHSEDPVKDSWVREHR